MQRVSGAAPREAHTLERLFNSVPATSDMASPETSGIDHRADEANRKYGGTEPHVEPAPTLAPMPGNGTPILWHAPAPWSGSGYGTQTALFGSRIAQLLGYDVAFSAYWGLSGAKLGWRDPQGNAYVVYPRANDPHGNEVMQAHFKDWKIARGRADGLFICLCDPWVLNSNIISQMPTVAWIPIDHEPLIPATDKWLKKSGAVPVAMARFGQRVMKEAGHDPLYVPHGFDSTVFKPKAKAPLRAVFGIPQSAFVVGMVAQNLGVPGRKCFPEAIKAFGIFHERHPDSVLYLHTQLQPNTRAKGVNIQHLCKTYGVHPMASNQYRLATHFPTGVVADMTNTFDVLLNASSGEGFGVPMVEAQACGVPVVTTKFSASPEVAPESAGNYNVGGTEIWTWAESVQLLPDVEEIVEGLETMYSDTEEQRAKRSESVRRWALEHYDADYVTEKYWKPALEEAQIRIGFQRKLMTENPF